MMNRPRPKAADYFDRDRAILMMTFRLGMVLAASVSRVFCDGKPSGHILRRLEARGLLTLHSRDIPGGLGYATLTAVGLKEIGIDRAPRKLSPTALGAAIAVSWYCTLEEQRRYQLLSEEVRAQYGSVVPVNVPHVITQEFGDPVVLRVLQSLGKVATTVGNVKKFFDTNRTVAGVAPALAAQDYGLLVLCPTKEKTKRVREACEKAKLFGWGRLVVGLGPTPDTLGPNLKRERPK